MEYINLLEGNTILKVFGLAVLTCSIIAVIEAIYNTEMMGEDTE